MQTTSSKESCPACCTSYDIGLLLLRLIIAAVGMYHGAQKLFGWFGGSGLEGFAGFLESMAIPMPKVSAMLAGGGEFFGGLFVGLGLLTRITAIPFLIAMLVAIIKVHPSAFGLKNNGMEYALTLAVILLSLIIMGGGRFSLDSLIFRKKPAPPPMR